MRTYPETGEDLTKKRRTGIHLSFRLLMLLGVLLVLILAWPLLQGRTSFFQGSGEPDPLGEAAIVGLASTGPAESTLTRTLAPTREMPEQSATLTADITQMPPSFGGQGETTASSSTGVWVIAMREGQEIHLFAYHPSTQPLTRLTTGPWHDITPAASPDGSLVAFASNRSGQWDLYTLDLETGQIDQITSSPEYEAAPSWSPDGLWLTYESYQNENLEIYVRPLAGDQPAIRLTNHPDADFSPAWSPVGRQIAFVSDRSGENEIWIANLDQPGEGQFENLSKNSLAEDTHPTWSPEGNQLAWASSHDGLRQIKYHAIEESNAGSSLVGSGDWPVWGPEGSAILSRLTIPNETYLITYRTDQPGMVSSPASLSLGPLSGMTWASSTLPDPLPKPLDEAASDTKSPLYQLALDTSGSPGDRRGLVDLEGIEAPYPQLHDLVDEAFVSLRLSIGNEIGWDLLASLKNAFVPLTASLPPGMSEDWLYTGRAFSFITSPLEAGWMVVVREDYGQETYWRVYGLARYQDGTQGQPLHARPWVFSVQNNSDISLYEHGGGPASIIPPGFWIDITNIAAAYGWERLPALVNWRSYFLGTRFNELVVRDGLDWRSAMLELYPPEALITPTVIIPPTRTPTPTIRWWRTPTPSATLVPPPTLTPSPSP